MKRIVILCDGTWNRPDTNEAGVPLATNVVKFAESIYPTGDPTTSPLRGPFISVDPVDQIVFYDPGIGTAGSAPRRIWNGMTGRGISVNIQEAYRFIIDHYEIGDELFLFGFSRGAFTVRSLAGLIRNAGILRRDAVHLLPEAYKLYRSRHPGAHPRERQATLFRRTHSISDITPIKFIGVWDTVGALGNPLVFGGLSRKNRFHDTTLSRHVQYAYHAMALDETRRNFRPTMWTIDHLEKQMPISGTNTPDGFVPDQIVEQRWFIGSHSNVGSGYKDTGLSDIPLQWLAQKAREAGLSCDVLPIIGNVLGKLTNSRTGLYRIIPKYHRAIHDNSLIHETVFMRLRVDPHYQPKNLIDHLDSYNQNTQLDKSQ